jgi:lipoprotein-anchoring transpeptidase ErfK/SrfK
VRLNLSGTSTDEKCPVRTSSRRAFLCASLASVMAGVTGCVETAHPENQQKVLTASEISRLRARYENEPHKFPLVDRRAFRPDLLPVTVQSPYKDREGSIVVNTPATHLYLQLKDGFARRYGIGVGSEAADWVGSCYVGRKSAWPDWRPTPSMRSSNPQLPSIVLGGAENPLGARALYLYRNGRDTVFRIHGTPQPWTIGKKESSGCIRMVNEDVIELFALVRIGASVRKI